MRVEVLGGVERRRRWSRDDKMRIIEETLAPGAVVTEIARRHGISTSLVFTWRRRARLASVVSAGPKLVPVQLTPAAAESVPSIEAPAAIPSRRRRGLIEIELGGGKRVSVDENVDGAGPRCSEPAMIPIPSGVRVWIATGHTDMRRGMQGLALQVQESLKRDPHAGDLYIFRGRRGDLAKILWHDGIGLSLYAKRLDRGKFIWPSASGDAVSISAAQMAYMLEGIDWRNPQLTWRPTRAG